MRSFRFLPPVGDLRLEAPRPAPPSVWAGATAKVVAGLVAGSGILNLLSLTGRFTPADAPEWIRRLFPLGFSGIPHSLTLLSGFALILAAIHLWGRKRRAWLLALVLVSASVVLHLRNGWEIQEAICSAAIALLLWLTRRQFTMGADKPQLRAAAARAVLAFTIAGLYGALGFWLLEPSEFHHNFPWWDAAIRTFRRMLFLGDMTLVPSTPYAAWFLDSLLLISASAFLYSGFVLFRPVAYRFTHDRIESALAGRIAAQHGRTAQDFFKHWPDKSYFFSSTRQSFLGYRVAGNYAVVLGDPVGPPEDIEPTIREFVAFCHKRGWRVGFHQVGIRCLPIYESMGFRKLRVGDDAVVDLSRFSLSGSAMKEFRNTVNRLDRLGYRVERIDPPLTEPLLAGLKRISDNWLDIPGHRERQFTLGRFEHWYLQSTPVYVAFDPQNHPVAFLNLVPSFEPGLATVDLMRRSHNTVNGLMDYLFAKVFLDLKQRGIERFSLGMAPLSGQSSEPPVNSDERIARWVMKRMRFLFHADSLRRFKAKYAGEWQPRYAVYHGRLDLPRFALALRRVSESPGAPANESRNLRGAA